MRAVLLLPAVVCALDASRRAPPPQLARGASGARLASRPTHAASRRALLAGGLCGAAALVPSQALAFANAIPEAAKFADRKKRRGPAPTDLGLKMRDGSDSEEPELKLCGAAPNCFSTTPDDFSTERMIPPWTAPKGKARDELLRDVADVVDACAAGAAYPLDADRPDCGGAAAKGDSGGAAATMRIVGPRLVSSGIRRAKTASTGPASRSRRARTATRSCATSR